MAGIEVPLKCECGKVRGVAVDIAPHTASRIVCMCDDCQAFAHALDRADVLDARGGTDILQLSPSQLRFSEGIEHLRCLRLSNKGLLRWYAGCCNTPIGNTMSNPSMAFVGLIHSIMDDAGRRDDNLGPVRCYGMAKFATASCEGITAHQTWPVRILFGLLRRTLVGRLKGKHRPTPFFNEAGEPFVTPEVRRRTERS